MHGTHSKLDLNLLVSLDVLLQEQSVGAAAARLHLSEPAMSRTLARIRKALGDPVLVRSGRAMVPTPRALAIHAEVHELVERASTVFTERALDLATLDRTFTFQADDSVTAVAAAALLARMRGEAPGVSIRSLPEGAADSGALREGRIDLEIGVIADRSPDVVVEPLLHDPGVGVVRAGHPLLTGEITLARFAAAEHLTTSRRGRLEGPIDAALAAHGLRRRVVASAPSFSSALLILLTTDLVGRAGRRLHAPLIDRLGLVAFDFPIDVPSVPLAMAWHRRYDTDAAHVWLRRCVRDVFAGL
ncbi:LysR family transcriptional regulator [Actinoallomurus bryophytorum]|uniref:LysR family transcriptional regulator n=1 Tax=Actinoallomurus bryophytorum TaxID=1490222 RepID=A0A543CP44_9ACTN|nr:LysR family transcriptional regulator [Actinoallomurus bryophytorum]TQL98872.1 LysR family transcriptional regulator [Actinoallomurus bryophytorum]